MSQPKNTKTQKPKLKVMHDVSKDGNGNLTITSRAVSDQPPVKEASKTKDVKPSASAKVTSDLSDEQLKVLQALNDLGGKDVHSMDIAKKVGFCTTYPDAPRAPVRSAMRKLHDKHLVTMRKGGEGYNFSITDKGSQRLQDKGAHAQAPASPVSSGSSGSFRPPNTDI